MDESLPRARAVPADREVSLGNGDRWQELRDLLVTPEQERLRAIERQLANPALNVEEVARLLPEAVTRRSSSDDRLGVALGPVVGEAIRASVRRDPQPLVDAIFPVMGPAIRRAIANALSELVQSINTSLEHTVSLRGLAWRVEAMRTGRSFGEVVLSRSLLFRVEQIFVIHRESGLLIEHRTATGVKALSPDMVASMMTALGDFARDSFHVSQSEGLDTIALGDLSVWVESGPGAILAAAIRGQPPLSLRQTLAQALEDVHMAHGADLERFRATGLAFPVREGILERCLISQAQEGQGKRQGQWRTWVLGALVLAAVGWCAVPRVLEQRRFDRFVDQVRREPGVVVGSVGRDDGRFVITGLRDPLARDPVTLAAAAGLDSTQLDAKWEPYLALRPAFVLQRAQALLAPSPTTTLRIVGDTLVAEGIASAAWRGEAQRLARAIPGITALQLTSLRDSAMVALRQRADSLETRSIDFPRGSTSPVPGQEANVSQLATRILEILTEGDASNVAVTVELVGSADSVGTELTNAALRSGRATRMRSALMARGIPATALRATSDTSDGGANLRQVRLRISLSQQ
jgi:OOP family OmpA-OmpF porin